MLLTFSEVLLNAINDIIVGPNHNKPDLKVLGLLRQLKVSRCTCRDAGQIGNRHYAFRMSCSPIAGKDEDMLDRSGLAQLPSQCMFSSPLPNHKNFHSRS